MIENLLKIFANIAAAIGVVVCALAGIARLSGSYHLFGYESMTLFIGGISLMVFSALLELHIIKKHILGKP